MNRWSLQYSYHLVVFIITKLSYIVAKAVVIEVYAIDLFFFVSSKQQRPASTTQKSVALPSCACICVFFFFSFSPDVRRLHHHLLLRLRLRHQLLLVLLYSTTTLDLCVSAPTTITTNSLSHSFIHSLTTVYSSSHRAINQRTKIINKILQLILLVLLLLLFSLFTSWAFHVLLFHQSFLFYSIL